MFPQLCWWIFFKDHKSINFSMIFRRPFLDLLFSTFWEAQVRIYAQNDDFEGFWKPRGSRNYSFWQPFRSKGVQKGISPNGGKRPGSDPVPNDPPKLICL